MRRADRAMSREQALAFLKEGVVGRLGLICQGEPYVVPLNYVVIDDRVAITIDSITGKQSLPPGCSEK